MKKVLMTTIIFLPFILGTIGFLIQGESFSDAAYYAFALYAVNPLHEESNILIEITRWLAPAVVASSLLLFIKTVSQNIFNFFVCLKKDSVTLYGNTTEVEILKSNIKNSIISPKNTISGSKNHIIMFDNELDSFRFFNENKNEFSNKNVFIKSNSIDMFKNDNKNFKILNFEELISKDYWNSRKLTDFLDSCPNEYNIAIIGFDSLGQKLLDYAILNNIYSLNQKICYHIWGDSKYYSEIHSDLILMNEDQIIFHNSQWYEDIEALSKTNRLIFSSTPTINSLIMLSEKYPQMDIDCFNFDENIINALNKPQIKSFGQSHKILTRDNLLMNDTYYWAKHLNYTYACKYNEVSDPDNTLNIEKEWEKLDSFSKNSNICAANYHTIRQAVIAHNKPSIMELAEMEHIRWCRFHYLNHWRFGLTETNKKDSKNRIHPCLVPFKDLSETDKQKDIDSINVLNLTIH